MRIYVARRNRPGLYLPMSQTSQSPSLLFPLTKHIDPSQLDELVRSQLEKAGISKESDVHATIERAEIEREQRIKTAEASREVRRLMGLRAEGKKLMQVGFRKWKSVYYPSGGKK